MGNIIDLTEIKEKKLEAIEEQKQADEEGTEWAFVCELCECTDEMRIIVGTDEKGILNEFLGFRCTNCGSKVQFYDEEEGRFGFVLAEDDEAKC